MCQTMEESTSKELLEAGIAAISRSGLAEWNEHRRVFTAHPNDVMFEKSIANLGRYERWICWTLFSVGVETVVKAVCVENGYRPVPGRLGYDLPDEKWSSEAVCNHLRSIGVGAISDKKDKSSGPETLNYGTLETLLKKGGLKLRIQDKLTDEKVEFTLGGIRLVKDLVRNRDVHTYQPNQRQSNFYLIAQVFVPCLNTLLKAIPAAEKAGLHLA